MGAYEAAAPKDMKRWEKKTKTFFAVNHLIEVAIAVWKVATGSICKDGWV